MEHRDPRDGTQRWISILVGAAVIGLAGYLTLESDGTHAPRKTADGAPSVSASSTTTKELDAGTTTTPAVVADLDAGLFLPTLSLGDAGFVLPSGAPRTVKIGVVLVQFTGAEGAPNNARSKRDAQALATRLADEARTDFHHAVGNGDPGSADDIGHIPRGVLDPSTEVVVFGLSKGDVSGVLETPKGFWIVKRVD